MPPTRSIRRCGSTPTIRRSTTSSATRSSSRRRSTEAQAEFDKALKIDPKLYKAHYRLGVTLQVQDKLREADAEYPQGDRGQPALRAAVPEARRPVPRQRLRQRSGAGVPERHPRQRLRTARRTRATPRRCRSRSSTKRRSRSSRRPSRANGELYLAYYNIGHTYKLLGDKKNAKEWLDKFIKGYSTQGRTGAGEGRQRRDVRARRAVSFLFLRGTHEKSGSGRSAGSRAVAGAR